MTCPHAETTAILALFGEAPPSFDAHLRGCADCQETLGAHQETLDLITPHLPAAPAVRLWPAALISTAAAAAAAALLLLAAPPAQPTAPPLAALDDEIHQFDEELLSLELELALMDLEDD